MEAVVEEQNNSPMKFIIIGVLVVIILAVGIGVFVYTQSSNPSTTEAQEQNTTTAQNETGEGEETQNGQAAVSPQIDNNGTGVELQTGDGEGEPVENKGTDSEQQTAVNQQVTPDEDAPPTAIPTINEQEPWLKLSIQEESLTVGQPVTAIVSGFSGGSNIDGYDVLLSYDEKYIEVTAVESLLEEFQANEQIRKSVVSTTGYKPPSVKEQTVFQDTELLSVTFTPLQAGETTLTIIPEKRPERTKFVDENVTVIDPQLMSLDVTIQ